MKNSVGLIEFKNITRGIIATDLMLKSAGVELLQSTPVCPGKYVVILGGELSAVKSSIDVAINTHGEAVIDSFVIGNVNEAVFPALSGTAEIRNKKALGIIETFTVSAAIEAADSASKAAIVEIVEIRAARGMGGKCFVLLTGSVGDCEAAVEAGAKRAMDLGMLVDKNYIPNPHEELWESLA